MKSGQKLSKVLHNAKTKLGAVHTSKPGLLVTKELTNAIDGCKEQVRRIAEDCRKKNTKFRDIEFDLENDMGNCLYGLFPVPDVNHDPADVRRVTQIFKDPQFFTKGGTASSNDIIQGLLGDCWFLSALATVSTSPGLVEKFCVARDEQVGVYGFIFFRDNSWVTVIIDDLLYTRSPKWEELTLPEQALYHEDKEFYNKSARKGGQSLYFARSSRSGETWVPLIEKAYAKLHGNYSYLEGGQECEAIEDLTGGVSTMIQSKDILDTDRFWREELTRANKDRLFGCSFKQVSGERSGMFGLDVQGLIGDHAYSVLRAIECNGKRFVVIRNPWGKSEWTGRWSDGSKEWTPGWLRRLGDIGHQFGDDGQFVMEYQDWLECFSQIDRTIFFDETWEMCSQWLEVTCPPLPSAWSHGEVSYKISVSGKTKVMIVLSQLDDRYFRDLSGRANWTIDFTIVREGEKVPFASSDHSYFYRRSVPLETVLTEGNYIVYVRLDRSLSPQETSHERVTGVLLRRLSRVMTERAKSKSIAENFDYMEHYAYIPTPVEQLIEDDLEAEEEEDEEDQSTADEDEDADAEGQQDAEGQGGEEVAGASPSPTALLAQLMKFAPDEEGKVAVPQESSDTVVIGLKVYTNKDVTCTLEARLKMGCKNPNCIACAPPVTVTITATDSELDPESKDA